MFTFLLIKRSGHTASLPWTILNVSTGRPLTWTQDPGKSIPISRRREEDLALMCWSMRANKLMILMYPWAKRLLTWGPLCKCQGVLCILLSAQTACWSLGKFKRGLQPRKFMMFSCTDRGCSYFIPPSVFYCFFILFLSFILSSPLLLSSKSLLPIYVPHFHLFRSLPTMWSAVCF